jgi:hypothetical protein
LVFVHLVQITKSRPHKCSLGFPDNPRDSHLSQMVPNVLNTGYFIVSTLSKNFLCLLFLVYVFTSPQTTRSK